MCASKDSEKLSTLVHLLHKVTTYSDFSENLPPVSVKIPINLYFYDILISDL